MTVASIAQELAKKYDLSSVTQRRLKKLAGIFLSHSIPPATVHKLLDEVIELLEVI